MLCGLLVEVEKVEKEEYGRSKPGNRDPLLRQRIAYTRRSRVNQGPSDEPLRFHRF